jgi:single-stranded-DNA-specific exonuclease
MTNKIWQVKPEVPATVLTEYKNPVLRQLLFNRGILDFKDAESFLNPEYSGLFDPFIFKEMRVAIERTWRAINSGEKIAVYGDYDADAVTANACLQHTFRYLGVELVSYIPDRFTEGYGLNIEAFQKLKDLGVTLVITVDCGTNSCDVADYCKANGMDLIITDHHEITADTPDSYALINPKNPSDVYPDNQITGVGVAFKFVCALLSDHEQVIRQREKIGETEILGWEKWLLDLVSIGTVADCHSLMGENRILVTFGLRVLKKTKWSGLKSLLKVSGVDLATSTINTQTLGFALAPRINAAGRLEHANIALQLLASTDFAESEELASRLQEINTRRQEQTLRIVSEAKEQAISFQDRSIIVVANSAWTKGVVGLAAGRLAEHYGKPVIVLEKGERESTGSARSVGSFDMVEALKSSSEWLVKFGGHKQAAGLTLKTEHLEVFYQKLLLYADSQTESRVITLELDTEINPADINIATVEEIAKLEPYGFGNPHPKFLIKNVAISKLKEVGKTGGHLQFSISKDRIELSGIGFSFGHLIHTYNIGDQVDIAVELMVDEWNGNKRVKLRLLDIRKRYEGDN